MTPTYTKQLPNGRYEFGIVECAKNRKKDRLVRQGECKTYEEAHRKSSAIADDTNPA